MSFVDDNGHGHSFSPRRQHTFSTSSNVSRTSSQGTSRTGSQRTTSSSSSSVRYPSDMTNFTNFSLETPPSTPLPPPLPSDNPVTAANYLSEDQLDFIDDFDYDDVDDNLIDHELGHRNREALVQQLLVSEQAYVESLETVARVFYEPLRRDAKHSSFSFLGMKKMVCTERETRWLFGNFEDILQAHREILESLEQRLRIWGPTQIISDVFQSWFPRLSVYYAYLDNYSVAVTTYERLTRYQPFKKFIDAAHKDPTLNGATLLSLLQMPAGCINRYAHLVPKLAESTSPMHPDYAALSQCKQRILNIAEQIRPKVMDADNVDQVLMIHQAMVGAPFSVKAQRRLVLQAPFSRSGKSSAAEDRLYILFSDMLVIVRPKKDGERTLLQYKTMVPLERATVRALPPSEAGGQEYCIEINSPYQGVDALNTTVVGSATQHILPTDNAEDQEKWIKRLKAVIHNLDRENAASKLAQSRRLAKRQGSTSTSSSEK